jgi:hypothetical protein
MYHDPLSVLGLLPGASWSAVCDACDDLLTIYDADRFVGDDRLQRRAEEMRQSVLEAFSIVEEWYGDAASVGHTPRARRVGG